MTTGTFRAMICLGGMIAAATAGAQELSFTRSDPASTIGARGLVVADFDRNGLPDLAHANGAQNSVTILLNHPASGLERKTDVTVGTGPFDLTAADFNRDGIPDLAVANADSHSISILIGDGTGAFRRVTDIATPAENPRGITTADINGDGALDLIYSGYAAGIVRVLLGTGHGSFTGGPVYTGLAGQPQGLTTADFNHDGHLDVAVVCVRTGLQILLGDGGTGFTGRAIAGAASLNVVATVDLNGDGWADIAAASTSGSTVSVFLGGAAGLVHAHTYPIGASPRGITIADVNGDGGLDILTANRSSNTVGVLVGDRTHPGAFLPQTEIAAGPGSRVVVAADFDGDGHIDIATANEYATSATVLLNTTRFVRAANVFTRQLLGASSGRVGGPDDVWPADFNHDGRLDVATLADEDPWTMSVLLTGRPAISLPGAGRPDRFAVADLNNDGNPDIVYTGCCSGTIGAYLGDGRGGFVAAPPTATPSLNLLSFVVGDMNRDGRPDLLFLAASSSTGGNPIVLEMIGHGDGTFHAGVVVALDAPGRDIRVVDVNRDGTLDIAVLRADGILQIWPGNGFGGVEAPPIIVTLPPFADADDMKFGDLNGDGYPDVVVAHGGGVSGAQGSLAVVLGHGDRFGEPAFLEMSDWGWLSNVIVLADVNVDGNLDIVSAGGDILAGNGDGTFAPNQPFDYRAVGLRVIDFTGDGLPDIVFGTSMGEVGVLVNERNATNRPPAVAAGPDVTIRYEEQAYGATPPCYLGFVDSPCGFTAAAAIGNDPDLHRLSFEWRNASGALVSTQRGMAIWNMLPGAYTYTLTASDGRGAVVTDSVVVTIAPEKEIVLHFCDDTVNATGDWSTVWDPGSTICRAYDVNRGAPKITAPGAVPGSYVRVAFLADPTQTYKLWLRLKADGNNWANDSVWVQFTGSTDLAGNARYRQGTTSGLEVSLEECVNCGVAGWGWQDDGWGAIDRPGVMIRFPQGGAQSIVIYSREDGVSVDHVVLSSDRYRIARPGATRNDTTILKQTYMPF